MITLQDPVYRLGALILVVLILSSISAAWAQHSRPTVDLSELRSRIKSWWIMAGVFFAAIAIDQKVSLVFFAIMSFWALKEYITLLHTRPADHGALFWAFVAIPIQYYWIGINWYGMFVLFIPLYLFLVIPVRLVLARETSGFVSSASQLHWGLMAFVFGLSHMGMLLQLGEILGSSGRSLLLFAVTVIELSDVLQYCWGKTCGRRRVIPSVSPNKTWEGLIGGVLTTAVLSIFIRFLTPFTVTETFLVALGLGIAGFFGGAVMSAVKRDFGVKDFGSIIPGHGGMLDRVDSLCFAIPLFFHYVRYMYF